MRNGILVRGYRVWVWGGILQATLVGAAGLTLTSCSGENSRGAVTQGQISPIESKPGEGEPKEPLDPAPIPARPLDKVLAALAFNHGTTRYTPIDITDYHLNYEFNVDEEQLVGVARVRFRAVASGYGYFFLAPSLVSAKLDGKSVSTVAVKDPQSINTYRAMKQILVANSEHEMEIRFEVDRSEWSETDSGVSFLTSFTDVTNWRFLNRYAVGNFESDTFRLVWDLELKDREAPHHVFANGQVTVLEKNRKWRVEFPDHYNSSGVYLHLSSEAFTIRRLTYAGLKGAIPITVYGKSASTVKEAADQLPGLFAELERDYGPYGHDFFIANMNRSSGGMEYEGATITTVGALDHELLHSWFARGVKPAEGRSGWFDEAIASWRDYGYARTRPSLTRTATNLSRYSIYQANTPSNSYSDGRKLMAEFDSIFADRGGYKSLLREFFAEYKHQPVTTELYLEFIQKRAPIDLKPYFDRFVYGLSSSSAVNAEEFEGRFASVRAIEEKSLREGAGHPRALTIEEERALR